MKLFDKKYVHFMWTDELRDKPCFTSDSIHMIMMAVNCGETASMRPVSSSDDESYPFATKNGKWKFAYYDPNYDSKVAFNEGKRIQYRDANGDWFDVMTTEPIWHDDCEYRIANEEHKHIESKFKSGDKVQTCNKIIGIITGYDCDMDMYFVAGNWYKAADLTLLGGANDSTGDCHEV